MQSKSNVPGKNNYGPNDKMKSSHSSGGGSKIKASLSGGKEQQVSKGYRFGIKARD